MAHDVHSNGTQDGGVRPDTLGTLGTLGSLGSLGSIELVGPDELATQWSPNSGDVAQDGDPAPGRTASLPRPDNRYVLLDTIGEGAMGTVHRAKDMDLRRVVAYKTVRNHGSADTARRLLTEVQVTAQLDHPAVVPVYGLHVSGSGGPGYAMKYVQGRTLQQVLHDARQELDRSSGLEQEHALAQRLDIFLRICDALSYAHSKGVIHRDLKPSNIMVGQFGEVYVMDWGIARVIDPSGVHSEGDSDSDPHTGTGSQQPPGIDVGMGMGMGMDVDGERTRIGQVFGTPAYMSPEQARGEVHRIDHRSDIYALGLILSELCVLRRANRAKGAAAQLEQARQAQQDSTTVPDNATPAPPELLAIARRATAAEPRDRYASVRQLAEDVRRYQRNEETLALPDDPRRQLQRWLSRHQQALLALVGTTVALAGLAILAIWAVQQGHLQDQALAAAARTASLTAFQQQVHDRGQRIDSHFVWVEGQLDALSAAAEYAFALGTPTDRPTFSAADYADPDRAPSGLVPSDAYGKPISPDYAVYTVAPGADPAVWAQDLAIADGLRGHLRGMLLATPPLGADPGSAAAATWIATRGNPIVWAYVAIDRSGLMYMSPGAAGWDQQYDPRTRPWYRVAVGHQGNVWGTPYVDLMGQGRLLSATRALHTVDGGFLGVAGVDLQFGQVIEKLVSAPDLRGYRTAYLVDGQGRVMVQAAAATQTFMMPATEDLDPGLDFGLARRDAVREAAITGASGQQVVRANEQDILVSWTRLPSLGWIYVVEADLQAWLEASLPQPAEGR